ncbi:MAG TPA: NAD(P)-binding oxidoreductase [Thermoanaerobaculia bacterium]|nr:NAD(P)-binding oxidoreductase [Thermoanaerobaculia bacterium]
MASILVLGATGGTGRQVLSQGIARGDALTALVRDPARLGADVGPARVVVGDVLDESVDLASAMRGHDAVVSVLGVGKSFRSNGLIRRAAPKIVRAMESAGVRRFVMLSAYGVGASMRDVPPLPRLFISLLLRDVYADKNAGEETIRGSSLDWTIVHAVTLTDGPRTGNSVAAERMQLSGFPRISRADVAAFLLTAVENRSFPRQDVLLRSG